MERLAIIIVNFNGGEYLETCLKSLKNQTYRPVKTLVIDNASTDGSEKIVGQFESVELIRLDRNIGFAGACNVGVRSCEGVKWIVLLNPDTVADPDWLQQICIGIRENPQFSSFASRMMCLDNLNVVDGAGDSYHFSGRPRRRFHGRELSKVALKQEEIFAACGGAAVYKRQSYLEAGGFDESFFCYSEDVDLGFRLQLMGYKCLYLPNAVIQHKGAAITGHHSDFQIYHAHRNLTWVYFKNMPMVLLIPTLPFHVLLNLYSLLLFSLRGKSKVIFRSKLDAIKSYKQVYLKRKDNLNNRVLSISDLCRIISFKFY